MLKDNDFNIDDFTENDFSDPILLLEALKKRESYISEKSNSVDSVKQQNNVLVSLSDIKKEYGINPEEIINSVKKGVLSPTVIIPLFSIDDIKKYTSGNVVCETIIDDFEKELNTMKMNYSYKPVLLLAIIDNCLENKYVKVDAIVDYFIEYYNKRRENLLTIEKNESTFVKKTYDRSIARRTIMTYPVNIFRKKQFIIYDKSSDAISFDSSLYSHYRHNDFSEIKEKCYSLLENYYSTL